MVYTFLADVFPAWGASQACGVPGTTLAFRFARSRTAAEDRGTGKSGFTGESVLYLTATCQIATGYQTQQVLRNRPYGCFVRQGCIFVCNNSALRLWCVFGSIGTVRAYKRTAVT